MGTFEVQRRGISSLVFCATSKGKKLGVRSLRESVERLPRAAILVAATITVLVKLFAFGAFVPPSDQSAYASLSSDKVVASIVCDGKSTPSEPHRHHQTHDHCILCLFASADAAEKFSLAPSRIALAFAPQEALFVWSPFADPELATTDRVKVNPARAPPAFAA